VRVAFVTPWIHGIRGNRIAFSVANELVRSGHEAEVFAHTIRPSLRTEIQQFLGAARLDWLVESERPYRSHLEAIAWQFTPRKNRALATRIVEAHSRYPFDAVVLAANEGRSLGRLLRSRLKVPQPVLGWSIMELIDHTFLLRHERNHPVVRGLASPAYPLIHAAWARAMSAYDFLMANSEWTGEIVEYLYGTRLGHIFMSLPPIAFDRPEPSGTLPQAPYIAVPTASLGAAELGLLSQAPLRGLPLVAYGPRSAPGLRHLGYLSEERMREFLAGAAATLFLFDYEALGLIPFESLALGTPVVTQPKHGVRLQWRSHPMVGFGRTVEELVVELRRWIERPATMEQRESAISSVLPFRAPEATVRFLAFLRDARHERDRLAGKFALGAGEAREISSS
jgi:hypothetical protein